MLGPDDLGRMAKVALGRVQPEADVIHLQSRCHVDHEDIARAGVEEGLKLALQMLQERFGSTGCLPADDTTARSASEASVPAPAVEPRESWR